MPDEVKEPVKGYNQEPVKKEKKKGILGKLKEMVMHRLILHYYVSMAMII